MKKIINRAIGRSSFLFNVCLLIALHCCFIGCASTLCHKQNLDDYVNKPFDITNYSKVIIYNTSSWLWCMDQLCAAVNIKINDKLLARLTRNDYLEIYVKKGIIKLTLDHWDIITFRDDYTIGITDDLTYIEVFSRPISTQFKKNAEVPEYFYERFVKVCSNGAGGKMEKKDNNH